MNNIPTAFSQGNYSIFLPYGLYYKITTMNEDCTVYNRSYGETTNDSIAVTTGGQTFITDELQTENTEYWVIHFSTNVNNSDGGEEIPQDLLVQIIIKAL